MRTIEVIRRGRKGTDGQYRIIGVETVTADRTLTDADGGKAFRVTSTATLTIPASVTEGWSIFVDADGADATISTAASINGVSSLVVTDGNAAQVYSTGSAHFARFFVASAITSVAASGVGFTPVTGNAATDVQAAIASNTAAVLLRAPIASPTLTGTPAAPTPSTGDNSTKIATTAFVQGEKASPALTGTPTAPTASAGTDTTQIATTAFVQAAQTIIAAGSFDGTGTPAWNYRNGFGATITDNGTGDYTVAFDAAEADANYVVQVTAESPGAGGSNRYWVMPYSLTTSGFGIRTASVTGVATDLDGIHVTVHRMTWA